MRRSKVLLLLLLCVARTNTAFTTRSTSKGTRPLSSKSICWASKAPSSSRGTSKASEIMNALKTRYDDDKLATNSTWSKTKNYVYQASDRLTLEQVNNVLRFLDQFFSPLLVRSILTTCPRILRKDVNTQIKPTIQFLQDLYGQELFSEAISRNPHLLLSSGVGHGGVNPEMDDYLLNFIGLTMRKIATLRKTAPFLFRLDTSKVQQVIQFLDDILERGDYDQKQRRDILGKIICTRPSLMNLSVERNLQPRIAFLMERCKLQECDAATLVKSSCGNVLGLSVDDNLCPTLDFLGNLLGQKEETNHTDDDTVVKVLRKCVLRHPQLLSLSLTNLQAKVDYFEAIDGLADDSPSSRSASLASRVAIRAPAVYSLSLKNNIVPTVEFLAKAWGTVSPEIEWQGDTLTVNQQQPDKTSEEQEDSLSSLLKEYPSILTMSLEGNIQPTLTFFNRTGYVRLDEEWRFLRDDKSSARPIRGRYIAASLFNRLLPRWHHLIANGWSVARQEGAEGRPEPSTLPPLHLLVGATDRAFCEAFSYSYEDYVSFKDKSVPRLKFSSQFDTWLKTGRPIDVQ